MCWHLSPFSRVEARAGERLPDYADSVTGRSLRDPGSCGINGAGWCEARHKPHVGMMGQLMEYDAVERVRHRESRALAPPDPVLPVRNRFGRASLLG